LLEGVAHKWQRTDENGVTEFAFDWKPPGATEPLRWRSRYRGHLPLLRLFVASIVALRRDYPQAYLLTNARAETVSAFNLGPSLGPLSPRSLADHPHAEAKFDYFCDLSARSDRRTHVLELGTEDLSPFHDQLLGLVPDPEYWALLLSKEHGLCSWLAGIPTHEGQAKAWEAKLLERFAALITVHEGQFLMIRTRDPELVKSTA